MTKSDGKRSASTCEESEYRPQHMKQRVIVTDAFDEAIFSLALRDAFDDVTFEEPTDRFYPADRDPILEFICDNDEIGSVTIFIGYSREASKEVRGKKA